LKRRSEFEPGKEAKGRFKYLKAVPLGKNMSNLNQGFESLEDMERFLRAGQGWLKKQHETGLAGAEFCQNRSTLIDNVLRRLWKRAVGSENGQASSSGLSLIAMGGYGREELNPFSDVDLLLLHFPGKGKDLSQWVQALLHPLWDWGLSVGYTVQTPKDTLRGASRNLDLFLAFLDSRWVGGDRGLFLQWEEDFSRSFTSGKGKEMILQIQQRVATRHHKLGDSVFVLEPEIKEGKGGLRDYHSALWAAKIRYPIRTLREVTERGLLNEREWESYSKALGFLLRVRNQLHYSHARREDRLSFEDQEDVARVLGYRGESSLQATESFLKDYFHQALQIYHLSWNMMEKCLDENSSPSRLWGPKAPVEIAPGFYLYHGRLALTDPSLFDRNPFNLWRAFETVHRHGMEMSASLKEKISQRLDLVNERFQSARESTLSFLSLFEKPGHLYRVFEAMHETGFLRRFLPEFERVHCHIQYDRYHLYPVDVHSLYAMLELEKLADKTEVPSWPLLEQLMKEVKDPGLLKLAALVHDLGKADGASHALRGEKIAETIGYRMGLTEERIDILRFLVREHLTFAEIAQRRDLNDENLIFRFARTAGDRERLKMLYLLVFADLRAVGPSAWTAWKDTLMRELFLKTLHLLERGEGLKKEDQERSIRIQREVMDLLRGQVPSPMISEYLLAIPSRHYQIHDARSLGQQILMAERLTEQTVVLDGEEKPEEGCDDITVVARDEAGLFAKICGVMTANLLNILSAEISTWENGIAVDRFRVQGLIEEGLLQPRRWNKLQEDLIRVVEGKVGVDALLREMVLPLFHRYPLPRLPTKVEVDNTVSDFYTVVEVFTRDRPGLLYAIARKIFEMGLNLWMARISTKVDQVVDSFYIQDLSGAKVEDEEKIGMVKKGLLEELEGC
jgi:[protein-PII] uridylyltransferase